jgi:hypothetical protein
MTAATMSENELQTSIVDLARLLKWRCAFFRAARTAHGGWRTPVGADGAGWPDLILVRDRMVVIEVKAKAGRLTVEQSQWLEVLTHAGIENYVFRPADWVAGEIEAVLRRRKAAA